MEIRKKLPSLGKSSPHGISVHVEGDSLVFRRCTGSMHDTSDLSEAVIVENPSMVTPLKASQLLQWMAAWCNSPMVVGPPSKKAAAKPAKKKPAKKVAKKQPGTKSVSSLLNLG